MEWQIVNMTLVYKISDNNGVRDATPEEIAEIDSLQKPIDFAERKLAELKEIQKVKGEEIAQLKIELDEAYEKLKKAKAKAEQSAKSLNGLLKRLQIAHEIAGIWITLFISC